MLTTCNRASFEPNPARSRLAACFLALTFAGLLISACAPGAQLRQVLPETDTDLKIRTEAATGQGGQRLPLAQPRTMTQAELEAALKILQYRESGLLGRSSRNPVFEEFERARLATALARGLANAGPSEQIRFASFSQRSGTLSQLRKTEAVAFVDRDGLLNLAFAGVHEFAGPDQDFFAFLELTERDPLQLERGLVALETDHPAVAAAPGPGQRPLWIRIDLALTGQDPPAPAPAPALAPAPAVAPAVAPASEPLRTTPAPPAEPEFEAASARRPTEVADPAPENLHQQLRERLEFLKNLFEDGLISAEEYEQQRREALRLLD